jgi:Common central domain of tyrosinase/Polyphenol oxidase middle domain
MKITLLSLMTAIVLLVFSFSYATITNENTLTPPKSIPLAMCSSTSPDIEILPDFFTTSTYMMSNMESLHIRKDISQMKADDPTVVALKKAITVMKKRPASDPTSWVYQANIHGTTATKLLPGWNSCTHHSAFFLSWHRMYLYFFERILRKASGDQNFALPYWDWTKSYGRDLPPTFREPKNATQNPLYMEGRDPKMNLGGLLARAVVKNDYETAMKSNVIFASLLDDNTTFNSTIEGIHGAIHVMVGGKAGLMRSIQTAAQDPIFWMHHCNIDHVWEKWMSETNPPLPDVKDPWMTQKFAFFDENGKRVTMSGNDIVDIAKQLNYAYEDVPIKSYMPILEKSIMPIMPNQRLMIAVAKDVTLSADKNVFPLSPTVTEAPQYQDKKFNLVFEKIKLEGWADGVFELYFNQSLDNMPDPANENYIGSVDFFGLVEGTTTPNSSKERIKNQRFGVTDAIRAYLIKNNRLDDLTVMIYHRMPELNGASSPQNTPVKASVGLVKLVQF